VNIIMKITELDRRVLKAGYMQGIQKGQKAFYTRLKINRNTTDYILEKLKKEKLFYRTSYEINLPSLGIKKFAWLFIAVNWINFDEEKFISKSLKFPEISSVLKLTGEYDYGLQIMGKNISKINEFILNFETIFQDEIEDTNIIFANNEYKRHFIKTSLTQEIDPNKYDCLILDEKLNDPSISLLEIAKKHNIHRNTVSNRWRNIWQNKILLKEHLELNESGYRELGLGLKLFIIIKPVPGKEETLIKHLINLEEVENIFTTLSNEIVLHIRVEDSQTLNTFHNKMIFKSAPIIKNSNTILVMGGQKKAFLPMETIRHINTNVCEHCFDN
jgi:DNA-binding Lrp family transcriptional regulator